MLYDLFNGDDMKRLRIDKGKINTNKRGRKKILCTDLDIEKIRAAIINSRGLVSLAASTLNVSLPTMRLYLRKYAVLRDTLFEAREHMLDKAESTLFDLIETKQNLNATMFYLKCLGKERGYIENSRPGQTSEQPLYIRLMPVNGNNKLPKATIVEGEYTDVKNRKEEKDIDIEQLALPPISESFKISNKKQQTFADAEDVSDVLRTA